jgi:hypothetical protein
LDKIPSAFHVITRKKNPVLLASTKVVEVFD